MSRLQLRKQLPGDLSFIHLVALLYGIPLSVFVLEVHFSPFKLFFLLLPAFDFSSFLLLFFLLSNSYCILYGLPFLKNWFINYNSYHLLNQECHLPILWCATMSLSKNSGVMALSISPNNFLSSI